MPLLIFYNYLLKKLFSREGLRCNIKPYLHTGYNECGSELSYLVGLECSKCGKRFGEDKIRAFCDECGGVLLARYDLDALDRALERDSLKGRDFTMWRLPHYDWVCRRRPDAQPLSDGGELTKRCNLATCMRAQLRVG